MPRPNVSEKKRADIQQAFERCFLKKSYDSISVREIAQEAGIAVGSIFFYYPAKEDILLAHVEGYWGKYVKDLEEVCEQVMADEANKAKAFEELFARLPDYVENDGATISIRHLNLITVNDRVKECIAKAHAQMTESFARLIRWSEVPCSDPVVGARILMGLLDGIGISEQVRGVNDAAVHYRAALDIIRAAFYR